MRSKEVRKVSHSGFEERMNKQKNYGEVIHPR